MAGIVSTVQNRDRTVLASSRVIDQANLVPGTSWTAVACTFAATNYLPTQTGPEALFPPQPLRIINAIVV